MLKLIDLVKKTVGFSTLLVALSANVFADFTVVKDIKADAGGAVTSYLKDDPKCNSCRGNARSAGVSYLEKVKDNSNNQEFLRGKVWSNSCQDLGNGMAAYGSLNASQGQCGFTEVKFLLPITKNADVWTADFAHIATDTDDQTQVQQVIPTTLTPTNFIQMIAVFAVKADPNYPALQIDIEQIFNSSKQYLD